ncbi:hypothetical protein BK659_02000 [Pseudomonas brassicacearum]|uniref:Uncharacterized protein n=2 Tax=Pseudomonas brassicacearum TaxID=930166 RepID=A0A423HCT6_9PSED|nr:hypothetical protein BK659_02000 [Pseudomonas brassicacearum]
MAQDSSQPLAGLPHGPALEMGAIRDLLPDAISPIRAQDPTVPMPSTRPMSNDPLDGYRVSAHSANTLPAADSSGLRIHANRRYADLRDNGTVPVGYDEVARAYRAKRRNELTPSGPVLRLNDDGKTWSMVLSTTAQPGTSATAPRVTIDTTHYVWNPDARNHHGYVVLHRKKGLDEGFGPETHLAFQDDDGSFVKVEPGSSALDQPANKLSAWTDRDLWDFYGLYGNDITRFRNEVTATGMKPQWAAIRQERLQKPYLLNELRRWLAPQMSRDEFHRRMAPLNYSVEQWAAQLDNVSIDSVARRQLEVNTRRLDTLQAQTSAEPKRPRLADEQSSTAETPAVPGYVTKSLENGTQRKQLIELLQYRMSTGTTRKSPEEIARQIQPYNLSTRQLSLLISDLQADGRFPQWAENLKHSSMDETNLQRFDEVYEELLPEIMNIRNHTTHHIDFSTHFTRPFLNALLIKAGYQRNKYNCLYRTDIPAMFRGDDRSPFEFFNGHMRPRQDHGTGSTTQKAVSASFRLSEAGTHTRVTSEVEALLYDTQYHRHPGKKVNIFSNRESDESSESSSSSAEDSDSHSPSDSDNRSDNSLFWDHEKNYIARRQNQNIGFDYLLDTRGIEVVPGEENLVFNAYAQTEKKPGENVKFPDDSFEGHISMSPRGLSADRIWLINSDWTRAAKVNDICSMYLLRPGSSGDRYKPGAGRPIEQRTWTGNENRYEYDNLIDQVANANKPVIDFPDKSIYSNDIVFP